MEKILNFAGFLVIAAALAAVSFYGVNKFAALKKIEIENQARFECAQSSRYQVQQDSVVTVWYPIADLYSKCLLEKGIK